MHNININMVHTSSYKFINWSYQFLRDAYIWSIPQQIPLNKGPNPRYYTSPQSYTNGRSVDEFVCELARKEKGPRQISRREGCISGS